MMDDREHESFQAAHEPVLPMADIQGIIVPGFLKQHHTLIGICAPDRKGANAEFRRFILKFAEEVTTASEALKDRRNRRAAKLNRAERISIRPLVAIAFSYVGLLKVTMGASSLPSDAFRQGLSARSGYLGDPSNPESPGHPGKWKIGGPDHELDALIVVAGDTRDQVDARADDVLRMLDGASLKVAYHEKGDVRDDFPGREHFGFSDGISQPGIRGRASDDPSDFVTPRHIARDAEPGHSLFGYPGQDLVWPGVLLLGQPATSPDPLIPGIPSSAVPNWSQNGSYLVFRRLRQHVPLFWKTMESEANRLSKLPGFEGTTAEKLAAHLVGRWPSGAPVNRSPLNDDEALGNEPRANNHFRFDSDAKALPLTSGFVDKYPQSKADPTGITCPWAAHIRKVNTRDSASDTGGRDSTYIRRILRVGIPYGKPLADGDADVKSEKDKKREEDPYVNTGSQSDKDDRGLLFLSIQASIEDQFEFLVTRWMGDPSRPKMPAGHDILVGQNDAAGEHRERRCVLFGSGLQQATVTTNAQWIVPTGGGYFFVPSLSALREVLGGI